MGSVATRIVHTLNCRRIIRSGKRDTQGATRICVLHARVRPADSRISGEDHSNDEAARGAAEAVASCSRGERAGNKSGIHPMASGGR